MSRWRQIALYTPSIRRVLRDSRRPLNLNDPRTPCLARSALPGSPRDARAAARTAAGRAPELAAGAHAQRAPQWAAAGDPGPRPRHGGGSGGGASR